MGSRYIITDVEGGGRIPGLHPLLSIGACNFENINDTFYVELKPDSRNYEKIGVNVAARGLRCLERLRKEDPRYDPSSEDFSPEMVLDVLEETGEHPSDGIPRFVDWAERSASSKDPILVVSSGRYDIPFLDNYRYRYDKKREFRKYPIYIDLQQRLMALTGDDTIRLKSLGARPETGKPHNALEDVFIHVEEFRRILELEKR
jgi:hypothetical protein